MNASAGGSRGYRQLVLPVRIELTTSPNAKAATRPLQADEIRKVLRRLASWTIGENLIDADPTAGVAKRVTNREARDRVLSDAEIGMFWTAGDGPGWPSGPLFKLLLLTAQRRDEVGGMRWSEIDLERRIWTIPAARAKNKRAHEVCLSDAAIELIENLPRTGNLLPGTGQSLNGALSRKRSLQAKDKNYELDMHFFMKLVFAEPTNGLLFLSIDLEVQ
jgi:integrase